MFKLRLKDDIFLISVGQTKNKNFVKQLEPKPFWSTYDKTVWAEGVSSLPREEMFRFYGNQRQKV